MKNIEYTDGFLLVNSLGWIYRLEDWGKVTAKLVNLVGSNSYLINGEASLTSIKDYNDFLQSRYRPFFLQINDYIVYGNELLQVVFFEKDKFSGDYIVGLNAFKSNGRYKYTLKYKCDEKFIKGFEYANRV